MPAPLDIGKNSILFLSLTTDLQKRDGLVGTKKIDREGAQKIVDFAAKDGLTFAESRFLQRLNKDDFSRRGQQVVSQFLDANPVAPRTDGADYVARTQRVIDRAAAGGEISFKEVNKIRNTFRPLEVTPQALDQQRAAVQALLDRTDLQYEKNPLPRLSSAGSLITPPTAREALQQLLQDYPADQAGQRVP